MSRPTTLATMLIFPSAVVHGKARDAGRSDAIIIWRPNSGSQAMIFGLLGPALVIGLFGMAGLRWEEPRELALLNAADDELDLKDDRFTQYVRERAQVELAPSVAGMEKSG